ncbi:MAG: L-aspartate oxidase [Phycisphaerae bacterium]|nr:L-aspartate oxidase [Phycisphaerae bacterium]
MSQLYDTRRYLTNFDSRRVPHLFTDVLVIGSGVAGLRAAIEAAEHAPTLLITKGRLSDSNTWAAQGGVAVVTNPADSLDAHIADTITVGCGLCDRSAVEQIVRAGPAAIEELIGWGAKFDRVDGHLARGREGGHSASRIVHARGDATGAEIAKTLIRIARETDGLRLFEDCFAIDLITLDGCCVGAITFHPKYGHQMFWARQTILATGGCGRVYRESTNPEIATGDGRAMAYRAGAVLRDMEMMQFHPTTLYIAGATRALISEAVRGEGAYLVNREGERFMSAYHADAELAPRDVVSRAIVKEMVRTGATCVHLDVRHIGAERFARRFPMISELCHQFDIDVGRSLIPVRPAAHYMVGGVATDLRTRTSVPGLLACGEVACTGLHGANRLASNSLLEGLVLGVEAGRQAIDTLNHGPAFHAAPIQNEMPASPRTELDISDVQNSLRSVMWHNVGMERHGDRLAETRQIIDFWGMYVMDKLFDDRDEWEVQNLLTVARLITASAARRTESRGVHFRTDYPETDDAVWRKRQSVQRGDSGLTFTDTPCAD